jgi:hypothetical protein
MICPNCGSANTHDHVAWAEGGGYERGFYLCEDCATRFDETGLVVEDEVPAIEPDPAFPELDGTIPEVTEWLEGIDDPDTLRGIDDVERLGRDRKGVHDAIEARLDG